jgi:hypothetical protein
MKQESKMAKLTIVATIKTAPDKQDEYMKHLLAPCATLPGQ